MALPHPRTGRTPRTPRTSRTCRTLRTRRTLAPSHLVRCVIVLALAIFMSALADAQEPVRTEHTHATLRAMRTPTPPVIDGRPGDEVWSLARPATAFTQQ